MRQIIQKQFAALVILLTLGACSEKMTSPNQDPTSAPTTSPELAENVEHPIQISPSNNKYTKKVEGFFLGHFDNVGERKGCRNLGMNLSRGGQPDLKSKNWAAKLKSEGISYVLDLRNEANGEEELATLKEGIGYLWMPIRTDGTSQRATWNYKIRHLGQNAVTKTADPVTATIEMLQLISQLTQKGHRVYIHCARGEDRTGVILGLLRKCDSWYSEFKTYGGSYYSSLRWLFENVQKSGKVY